MNTSVDKSLSLNLNRDMCPKTSKEKEKTSIVPYVSVVSSLMYAMRCIRPDICYVIRLLNRYQSNLSQKHWITVKRIL
jgi:hypothetical protein